MIVYEFPVAADGTFSRDKSGSTPTRSAQDGAWISDATDEISSKPSTGLQQRYATKPMDHCSRNRFSWR